MNGLKGWRTIIAFLIRAAVTGLIMADIIPAEEESAVVDGLLQVLDFAIYFFLLLKGENARRALMARLEGRQGVRLI